jgi:hypothetical protein
MTDSLWLQVGGARMPLQDHDVDATALSFEALDPVLGVFAGLLTAAIRAELGTTSAGAWQTVSAALPTGHRLLASSNPVGSVWRMAPSAEAIKQIELTWPLLAIWREGQGEWEQRTMMKAQVRTRWNALWSLGDLDADLGLKLGQALQYVGNVMAAAIERGKHPAYESGVQQYGTDSGDLIGAYPVEVQAGRAMFPDNEDSKFWGTTLTFETLERVKELDEGADDFAGSLSVGVGNELEIIPDLVVGDADYPGT